MKTNYKFAPLLTLGLASLAVMAAGTASADARQPRAASSTVTRTGAAGNSATRKSSVATDGNGGYTAGSTVTGSNGKTASRQQSGSYDPATQTYSRAGTTTGPDGQQSSFNSTTQKTADGYVHAGTRTGPNGQSVTTQGGATYDPATGTANQARTTTGPNGKSASESRTIVVPAKSSAAATGG
jgi:hypothetical protein